MEHVLQTGTSGIKIPMLVSNRAIKQYEPLLILITKAKPVALSGAVRVARGGQQTLSKGTGKRAADGDQIGGKGKKGKP